MISDSISGIQVDLDKIETEFKNIWKQTLTENSDTPTVKASSLNLIITSNDPEEFNKILEIIPEITEHHPGRIIMALIDPKLKNGTITSKISAFCHPPREDGLQLCCELITLETGPDGEKHLPGTLLPLLLPDLPVFLWSSNNLVLDNPHIGSFYQNVERTILNSPHTFKNTNDLYRFVKQILITADVTKVSDLRWAGLTNWREAVARLFDGKNTSENLAGIHKVLVQYSGSGPSSEAYFAAGWLASRLNWYFEERKQDGFLFSHNDQKIQLVIQGTDSDLPEGEITFIRLESGLNGEKKQWYARAGKKNIELGYNDGQIQKKEKLVNSKLATAWLIGNELDYVRADDIYLNSVEMISKFLNSDQGLNHELY